MIVETAQSVPWTKPDEVVYDPKGPLPQFGNFPRRGFTGVMFDGVPHTFPTLFPMLRFVPSSHGGLEQPARNDESIPVTAAGTVAARSSRRCGSQEPVEQQQRAGKPWEQRLSAAASDQPDDAVDDLADGPDAKRRRRRFGPRLAIRGQYIAAQRRVHKGGRHDADVNAVRRQFQPQGVIEPLDGKLARSIKSIGRYAALAGQAADRYQTALALADVRQGEVGCIQSAEEVDLHDSFQGLERGTRKVRPQRQSRRANQHVQAPQIGSTVAETAWWTCSGWVTSVGSTSVSAPMPARHAGHFLQAVPIAGGQGDVGPQFRQLFGRPDRCPTTLQ